VDLRRCQVRSLQKRAQSRPAAPASRAAKWANAPVAVGKSKNCELDRGIGSTKPCDKALRDMSIYNNSLARPSKTQNARAN